MNSIHTDLLGCETRFYQTGSYRTRVIERGEGTPLFLMHGGGGHAETYSRNLARLSRVCRPMAMDFIWHGLSSAPPFQEGNWLAQFTDQVIELLDHLGVEKAHFEGESLGGWICFDLALRYPERIDKLILNTPWGMTFDSGAVEEREADLDALRTTSVNALQNPSKALIRTRLEWLMPRGGITDELIDIRYALWSRDPTRSALIEYYERLFHPSCDALLFGEAAIAKVGVQTLVLWTDSNPIHGVDAAERLHTLIQGSSMHVIRDAGHWPQWEHPLEHDEAVTKFLES